MESDRCVLSPVQVARDRAAEFSGCHRSEGGSRGSKVHIWQLPAPVGFSGSAPILRFGDEVRQSGSFGNNHANKAEMATPNQSPDQFWS